MSPNLQMENIVKNLDVLSYGYRRQQYSSLNKVRDILTQGSIDKLQYMDEYATTFSRRITSICWHPMHPYYFAAGSKFGDISITNVERSMTDSTATGWSMKMQMQMEGAGAGGSITAMMFDRTQRNLLYTASIDSKVSRVDLENPQNPLVYYDYASYEVWFTAMDINFEGKLLTAADNKGKFRMFSLEDAKPLGVHQLHKSKIHHIQFNKLDPTKFVTSSLRDKNGENCKIWDIRNLNLKKPLHILKHNAGVNCSRFSPVNGQRLLTSDQVDEIRVYEYPYTQEPTIIKHHHKQFQHLTPIKAEWHPMADLIVIGKYPKANIGASAASRKGGPLRTIEFYNPDSGNLLRELVPPLNEIVSLNVFNPTGELLASGMNSKLVIWRPSSRMEEFGLEKPQNSENVDSNLEISQELQDKLRGRGTARGANRRAREFSPTNDSDDESDANKKKGTKRPRKSQKKDTQTTKTTLDKASTKRPSRKK